jgi:hypothetical protein
LRQLGQGKLGTDVETEDVVVARSQGRLLQPQAAGFRGGRWRWGQSTEHKSLPRLPCSEAMYRDFREFGAVPGSGAQA